MRIKMAVGRYRAASFVFGKLKSLASIDSIVISHEPSFRCKY